MIKKLKNLRFVYIFYISAVLVLFGSIAAYALFSDTKSYIEDVTKGIYINDVYDVSQNISNLIVKSTKKDIYSSLKNDKKLIKRLESSLRLFISDRYRYVYVVTRDKSSNKFMFLLDGSPNLEDKSEFEELYEPLNMNKFLEAYDTKKEISFTQDDAKGVWITFLKPIVKDGKTQALLVIDFSMQGHILIDRSLYKLDRVLELSLYLSVLIFILITVFAFIDQKRSKELLDFNKKLSATVESEVEKNRQKDQQLIHQSRLAQMGEMISMIAHQWRQPLSAISGASNAIKLKTMLGKNDKEVIIELSEKISQYAQHLSSTIDDFRNFFKSNKEMKNITYAELVGSVLDIVETSILNKDIKMTKECNSDKVFNSYPNELKQVILNLLKNAEDVLLEREIQNPEILIKTQHHQLSISDNGGGIPEDIIDKIFDPYFSTKSEKNGTGLGLYMSKTIIEEHCKGKLNAHNDKDGAVFTIVLNSIE